MPSTNDSWLGDLTAPSKRVWLRLVLLYVNVPLNIFVQSPLTAAKPADQQRNLNASSITTTVSFGLTEHCRNYQARSVITFNRDLGQIHEYQRNENRAIKTFSFEIRPWRSPRPAQPLAPGCWRHSAAMVDACSRMAGHVSDSRVHCSASASRSTTSLVGASCPLD